MRPLASLFSFLLLFSFIPEATAQRAACTDGRVTPEGSSTTYDCNGIDFLGHLSLGELESGYGNDIWGWTDPDTGKEYALVGLFEGTAFVDVSEPTDPVYLGRLDTRGDGSIWRDIKVYADHAFIVSEASNHGIQVYDLTQLRGLTEPVTHAETARYTGIGSAHNIVINEATGFAYAVGSRGASESGCSGGLHIVNIQTPAEPEFEGCFSNDGYTHDAQCVIYDGPDSDYTGREICIAYNEDTVSIINVTNKRRPDLVSQVVYPNFGYVHQGWLTEDHRYIIHDDEGDESSFGGNTRTLVSDLSDLDEPEFLDAFEYTNRAIDHNLYVKGDYAYASNYSAGLRVLDTSVIGSQAAQVLDEVAFFDTNPVSQQTEFSGTWSNYPFFESGTIIVNDTRSGLFVLDVSVDNSPVAVEDGATIAESRLLAAYPNPTTGRTTLTLQVREAQQVTADVYDSLGRHVETLFEGVLAADQAKALVFDGSARPAGLYVVRVAGEDFAETQRVVLTR